MRAHKQRKLHEDWTYGLKTRTANALRAHGFQSKGEVAATPIERLLRIEHFGEVSLADVRAWLLLGEWDDDHDDGQVARHPAGTDSATKLPAPANQSRRQR